MWEKALADKANEQRCQESAERAAATAKKALTDKAHEQRRMAKHATTCAVMVLTKLKAAPKVRYGGPPPTHFSPPLTTAEVAELDAAILDKRRCHEMAVQEKALAEDIRRPEETAAIRRIWVECALLAAPLDAILAEIERDTIAHEARALPTTTSPHSAAMLSTPPHPMTYVGMVLSTMGGSSQATPLPLAQAALPSPAIDGKLRTVRQRDGPRRRVGRQHGPRAPNPQEHLLCGRQHQPCTPNQSTVNGWA